MKEIEVTASRAVAVNPSDPQNHMTDRGCRVLGSAPRDPNPAGTARESALPISKAMRLQMLRAGALLEQCHRAALRITSDWDPGPRQPKNRGPDPHPQQPTSRRARLLPGKPTAAAAVRGSAREHQGTCLSLRLLSPASLPLFLPPSGHISCSGNKRHSGAGLNSGQLGGPSCSPQGLALLSWKKTASPLDPRLTASTGPPPPKEEGSWVLFPGFKDLETRL